MNEDKNRMMARLVPYRFAIDLEMSTPAEYPVRLGIKKRLPHFELP